MSIDHFIIAAARDKKLFHASVYICAGDKIFYLTPRQVTILSWG